jgi:hypothetical protein
LPDESAIVGLVPQSDAGPMFGSCERELPKLAV